MITVSERRDADVAELRAKMFLHQVRVSSGLQTALSFIVDSNEGECERSTAGIGSCFDDGYEEDAEYADDRACSPCIAHRGLQGWYTEGVSDE